MARPKKQRIKIVCENSNCNNTFEIIPGRKTQKRFCSKKCSNSDVNEIAKMKQSQQETWKEEGGHPMSKKTVQEKHRRSMLKNHGVEHALQKQEIAEKAINKKIKKYGNCNNIEKVKSTKLKKYGNIGYNGPNKRHVTKYKDIIDNWKHLIPHFNESEFDGVTKNQKYKFECVECGYIFNRGINNGYIPRCKRCAMANQSQTSKGELQIVEFIKSLLPDTVIETKNRNICNGYELDIYLPEYKLAIEFNGIYWHSFDKRPDADYHLNKTKMCIINGITLLHIFDYQWYNKQDIVKSMICSKLKLNNKIFGRKCNIKEIKTKEKNQFLESTHIQGKCNSTINIGLYNNNELVSVAVFSKSRYNKNYDYELVRFSSKLNTNVIGGFSKIMKYFINTHNPKNIISYADRSYSIGNVYLKNNFKLIGVSKPNYFYFKELNVYSRQSFQKHLLSNKLQHFNKDLTEYENMKINGYDKFYNCGNYIFTLII